MPKLYEYMGIVVLFYSNEHEPVHVHGKYQGREMRAELIIEDGRVVNIVLKPVRGRRPLESAQLKDFETLVSHYSQDYFVLHRQIKPEVITRRIK
jgi:hypothetical protein